jgi:hypothetical protein
MNRRSLLKLACASIVLKNAELPGFPKVGPEQDAKNASGFYAPLVWPSTPPADIPFAKSDLLKGIRFTGRHKEYTEFTDADTWFPSWAEDGEMYSPFEDGSVKAAGGRKIEADGAQGIKANQGYAKITGSDPLNLSISALGNHHASALPFGGRYACANLSYQGIWYLGTYCCDVSSRTVDGVFFSWASLEPFVGFMVSRDCGQTWEETPHTPWAPLFPEVGDRSAALEALARQDRDWRTSDVRSIIHGLPQVKIGTPHFVDFGRNMQYSPDGKAYLIAHGTIEPDAKPRFANNSWIAGDQLFMVRVMPSPSNINDTGQYEYFAGSDIQGRPRWSSEFARIQPLVDWNNHCGSATMTYNRPLKKYLMCIADSWPGTREMNTYILESSDICGPWRLVAYMTRFGEQGYFVNIPSKFISEDGRKCWLCYSANYTEKQFRVNPPGGCYSMCLHEFELL